MKLYKTDNYNKDFVNKNMMGPNSMLILEELTKDIPLKKGMKVLDLGCGTGLTSIFLAKEFGVEVYAVDLWISATENYRRFKYMNLDNLIIPINTDANNLPFAEDYFDVIISVDSYHYFGNNDTYFPYVKKFLKKDGILPLSFVGMKFEVHNNIPKEMEHLWEKEALEMWHSIEWWKPKFENYLYNIDIGEIECFERAWQDWLNCGNSYVLEDKEMIETDNGRFMNIIYIKGNLK